MRAFLLLLADLKTTAWRESIYFLYFICHFKNMATVSTIRRHPRDQKRTLSVHGISHKHIFIYTFQLLFD